MATAEDGKAVEVRTEVGLLSHNVRIEGAPQAGVSPTSVTARGFGCHVRVEQIMVGGVLRRGSVELSSVEIVGCGQEASLRHALQFEQVPGGGSYIRGSSVHSSNAVGIRVKDTPGLEISGTVVHITIGSSIAISRSDSVLVDKTLALSVYARIPGTERISVLANFEMCVYDLETDGVTAPCSGTVLRDSTAAGSHHTGVLMYADDCTSATRGVVLQGEIVAHSTRAGFLALGRPDAACAGLAGFTVHHTTEVGVALPYNAAPNVRRCRLTASKPVLKAPLVSALETKI